MDNYNKEYKLICSPRGRGRQHINAEWLKRFINTNKDERIVFTSREFQEELDVLKNYQPKNYDDVPDSIRYNMEYLGFWKGDSK